MKIWSQVGIDLMCLTDTEDFEEDKRGYRQIIIAQLLQQIYGDRSTEN